MTRPKRQAADIVPTRALLSVYDKTGLIPLARALHKMGVSLLSTGGTADALRRAHVPVQAIADITGAPEILGGRVKTLHPKIHGGLLGRWHQSQDRAQMIRHDIAPIDILVVNLYPFEQRRAHGGTMAQHIEDIDIGGPAMIRAGAKNMARVSVLVEPADYGILLDELKAKGSISKNLRQELAQKAFARVSVYDSHISSWLAEQQRKQDPEFVPPIWSVGGTLAQSLRYGENPHQRAGFYRIHARAGSLAKAHQIQGKALSYNNIQDADAAWALVNDLPARQAACAIIKHANPCGVALASNLHQAFLRAKAGDPVSAFGGIIACNQSLNSKAVTAMLALFSEVIIAPDATSGAKRLLASKKNLRVLLTGGRAPPPDSTIRSVEGGVLVQTGDDMNWPKQTRRASKRPASTHELSDLRFAWTVAKYVKSNAIVLAKHGQVLGVGAGQMSRLDSVAIAIRKAQSNTSSLDGAVLASDAFFPFADGVELAAQAGITAIVQPGGSIRDKDVRKVVNKNDMAMILTGERHFRH